MGIKDFMLFVKSVCSTEKEEFETKGVYDLQKCEFKLPGAKTGKPLQFTHNFIDANCLSFKLAAAKGMGIAPPVPRYVPVYGDNRTLLGVTLATAGEPDPKSFLTLDDYLKLNTLCNDLVYDIVRHVNAFICTHNVLVWDNFISGQTRNEGKKQHKYSTELAYSRVDFVCVAYKLEQLGVPTVFSETEAEVCCAAYYHAQPNSTVVWTTDTDIIGLLGVRHVYESLVTRGAVSMVRPDFIDCIATSLKWSKEIEKKLSIVSVLLGTDYDDRHRNFGPAKIRDLCVQLGDALDYDVRIGLVVRDKKKKKSPKDYTYVVEKTAPPLDFEELFTISSQPVCKKMYDYSAVRLDKSLLVVHTKPSVKVVEAELELA